MYQNGTSRNIGIAIFPEIKPNFDWNDQDKVLEMLDGIAESVKSNAADAIAWYFRNKALACLGSRWCRGAALGCLFIAAMIPLITGIVKWNDELLVNPAFSAVAVLFAATSVGIDRFFGFSASYVRYVTTARRIQRLIQDFSADWLIRRAAWGGALQVQTDAVGGPPVPAKSLSALTGESLSLFKSVLGNLDDVIQSETRTWVKEFLAALAEVDNNVSRGGNGGSVGKGTASGSGDDTSDKAR